MEDVTEDMFDTMVYNADLSALRLIDDHSD